MRLKVWHTLVRDAWDWKGGVQGGLAHISWCSETEVGRAGWGPIPWCNGTRTSLFRPPPGRQSWLRTLPLCKVYICGRYDADGDFSLLRIRTTYHLLSCLFCLQLHCLQKMFHIILFWIPNSPTNGQIKMDFLLFNLICKHKTKKILVIITYYHCVTFDLFWCEHFLPWRLWCFGIAYTLHRFSHSTRRSTGTAWKPTIRHTFSPSRTMLITPWCTTGTVR